MCDMKRASTFRYATELARYDHVSSDAESQAERKGGRRSRVHLTGEMPWTPLQATSIALICMGK